MWVLIYRVSLTVTVNMVMLIGGSNLSCQYQILGSNPWSNKFGYIQIVIDSKQVLNDLNRSFKLLLSNSNPMFRSFFKEKKGRGGGGSAVQDMEEDVNVIT